MERKPDADKIRVHLEELADQYEHNTTKKHWPKFLFRVENITSAASILNSGVVYSRAVAIQNSISCENSACQDILDHTANRWKEHVRLHFRPATAYHQATEGIRPISEIRDAHCPVPILLLFDSYEILSRKNTKFSNGNLSSLDVVTGDDYEFFQRIPFDCVYKKYKKTDKGYERIKFHNQAEAMVPQELKLDALKYVICRSQPERETLITLLDQETRRLWEDKVRVYSGWFSHFYKYVQSVQVVEDQVLFNLGSGMDGDYNVQVRVRNCDTEERSATPVQERTLGEKLVFKKPGIHSGNYELELLIDSHLAYKKILSSDDVPF